MRVASNDGSKFWSWVNHYYLKIMVVLMSIGLVGYLIDISLLRLFGSFGVWVYVLGSFSEVRHTGLFCDRCMERVELNGEEKAQRRPWPLWFIHQQYDHPYRTFGILIGILLLDIVTTVMRGGESYMPWIYPFVLWPFWFATAWSSRFHNKVLPWCPYCRDDDGDGDVFAPEPDPVINGTKVT